VIPREGVERMQEAAPPGAGLFPVIPREGVESLLGYGGLCGGIPILVIPREGVERQPPKRQRLHPSRVIPREGVESLRAEEEGLSGVDKVIPREGVERPR